jgi:hypothetical protein
MKDAWYLEGHTAGTARRFVSKSRELKTCLTADAFATYVRHWRVFPRVAVDTETPDTIRTHLSDENLKFALDCIRIGL